MMVLLLAGVGAAFLLQKYFFEKNWHKKLEIQVEFEEHFAYEGDVSTLKEEISNGKKLPLPAVEVRLSMDRSLKFHGDSRENSDVTDQSYRRDMFALSSNQKIIRRLSFVCEKRGFYRIDKAGFVGYDFFFGGDYYREHELLTELYVYPKPVNVNRIKPLCQAVSGMILTQNRLYPDPFEFAGIREYRTTDPMNHINWKASAGNGKLMVNQFDSTTSIQVCIILDVGDEGILKYEELTEEGIRITASLAAKMVRQNMEIEVVSNGMPRMHLKPGAGQTNMLYRELACIDISLQTEGISGVITEESRRKGTECVYVLISHNQDDATVQAAMNLACGGRSVLWVLPVSPLAGRIIGEVPGVQIMEWEAE